MIEETSQISAEIPAAEQSATQLPEPSGYRILLALPKSEDTFASGIVKAEKYKQIDEVSSVVGFILAVGPDAYKDAKFQSGPWCKKGDFVLIGPYRGARFKIHDQEFRMINDDDVLGVVQDPRGYARC